MPESRFFRFSDCDPLQPADGVSMRGVFGEGASISLVRLEPDAVVESHSHPHEQLGFVIDGIQVLIIDGVEHHIGPYEAYALPGGVVHAGRGGPDGCTVVDVFVPRRDEYGSSAAPALESLDDAR